MASMIMNRASRGAARDGRGYRRPASIICPIDFSQRGVVALQYAAQLARQRCGRLIVVHVLPMEEGSDSIGDEPCESALDRLEHFVPFQPGVRCEWVVLQGNVAEQIVELASGCDAPQIVMATRGRKGSTGALVGRTAEQVLRRAPCPVVMVNDVDVAPPPQSLQFAGYDATFAHAAS